MRVFNIVAMFCIALVLAACSDPKPILRTDLPKATALVLYKAERRMYLFQGNTVIKEYGGLHDGRRIGTSLCDLRSDRHVPR